MNTKLYTIMLAISSIAAKSISQGQNLGSDPNLVIIMTDEHNVRTLGCYRSVMQNPNVWGEGLEVDTPNIDSLAADGAIFTNFNTIAPLCTPSRGSFMSGLYPEFNGAAENHMAMNADVETFANVLQRRGYATGYVGKWHLNGDEKPGFSNENRRFGFYDIKYQFNRGHWKLFEEDTQTGEINAYDWKDRDKVKGKIKDTYVTDFLVNKGVDFLKNQIERKKKFALMLSIPDPHGPNDVRPPYDTMYNDMNFKLPLTGVAAYNKEPALPGWAAFQTDLRKADETIDLIENDEDWQANMRNYFGMVKLVDDKVGELLSYLRESGQDENTIVVFTSDHGDMMGEHGKYNKGKPYLTAAGAPFIIRYPGHIKSGKIIQTAYSSPDFAPTILSLLGLDHSDMNFQGIDGSDEILNDNAWTKRHQVRFITDSRQSKWAAAVDRQYKLVLASSATPWLFDLKKDPDEIINYIDDPSYSEILDILQSELLNAMDLYKFPIGDRDVIYVDNPVCVDTKDQIPYLRYRVCRDLSEPKNAKKCNRDNVRRFCPENCGVCCEDSKGVIRHMGKLQNCAYFKDKKNKCNLGMIASFCPVTCSKCIPEPSPTPSISPSLSNKPSSEPSNIPSNIPSNLPSMLPSITPSAEPSLVPTDRPTAVPSKGPSGQPTVMPSYTPSVSPSLSNKPSSEPPTSEPSSKPSQGPTVVPSVLLSTAPSSTLTAIPSTIRSNKQSLEPWNGSIKLPSIHPTINPTAGPKTIPSDNTTYIISSVPTNATTLPHNMKNVFTFGN